jgi:hypothetical protein
MMPYYFPVCGSMIHPIVVGPERLSFLNKNRAARNAHCLYGEKLNLGVISPLDRFSHSTDDDYTGFTGKSAADQLNDPGINMGD